MNIWKSFERKCKIESQGLSLHFDKGLDCVLKEKYISLAKWLRANYAFPIHINVYILNVEKIQLKNGLLAYGSFRWFSKRPPIIKVASAIEADLFKEYHLDELHEQILSSLIHEITHYYQWVLGLEQTNATSERQANYFRYRIIEQYYRDNLIPHSGSLSV